VSDPQPLRLASGSDEGDNLAAISRRVVRLYKERYGRGPTRARTYHWRDVVVVLLREGYTPLEQTLREAGRSAVVNQLRSEFQPVMADDFKRIVEEELRREVIAFMSASHMDPDMNAEVFVLAPEQAHHGPTGGFVPAEARASEGAPTPSGPSRADGAAGSQPDWERRP
jgi:uncharacterized protein YbcI